MKHPEKNVILTYSEHMVETNKSETSDRRVGKTNKHICKQLPIPILAQRDTIATATAAAHLQGVANYEASHS